MTTLKTLAIATLAILATTLVSCNQNEPEMPKQNQNPGNNTTEQTDPLPAPQAADVTIAMGVTADWMQIADLTIYDANDNAAALTDVYTNYDLGKMFIQLQTAEFEGSTCIFKGLTNTKNFQPGETVNYRAELKLKDNYMEILQGMEEGAKLNLLAMHVCATQVTAPEYHVFLMQTGTDIDVKGMLNYMEKNPDFLTEQVAKVNNHLSGSYAYDGYTAGVM